MDVSKGIGLILLAGVVSVLLGGRVYERNSVVSADGALPTVASSLPKDIYPDSRNRLPLPKREDMDDYGKKVFDETTRPEQLAGTPQPSFRLYSPRLAKPMAEAHYYVKYETGLPDRLLEIAVLVTAREMGCQYEWTQWETHGRDPHDPRHIEPAIIDIIKYNKPVVGLGQKETVIIAFGREMFGQRKVSSATFAEALRLFGRRGTVDLVELMSLYSATAAEVAAFDVQLKEGQKPLLPAR
jgi:4-carboxymuconolactone decarboxylase